MFDRGYTGHEHLDKFALINMNGRVYDPVLARFLSPDPIIQNPENTQSLNRYSYVVNNPMKYTDPSGYVFDDIFNAIFAPIDFIAPAIYFGLNGLTLPARIQAEIDQVHNDVLFNGGIDPNGYFNLNYMLTGYRPVPYGFDISQNSNFYAPGPRGGFVSADGTFHDNNDIAKERMGYFQRHIEQKEEGDFNYMALDSYDPYAWVESTGMMAEPDTPPTKEEKEGSETVEEKKGQTSSDEENMMETAFGAAIIAASADGPFLVGDVIGIAILSCAIIKYMIDNPFPKPWTTSRGKSNSMGRDPVIQGFDNNNYYGPEGPPKWFWPAVGGAGAYELYKNWQSPAIPDTNNSPVLKPDEQ
jgi:RHS repeat-associated protein